MLFSIASRNLLSLVESKAALENLGGFNMSQQTQPYTYGYKDGSYATVGMEELFDRQANHDDLRIRDRFIEFDDDNHNNVSYLTYIIDKREDDGAWERYVKVVKLCKVYNVPKEMREKKALMVSQDELLSAI